MLITRYKNNPILTKDDVPFAVATVHNAAVVKHEGKYIMIFRSHKLNGRSMAISGSYNQKKFMKLQGYVHNVVFCCGAVPEDDGSVKIYWGGADKVMCVGTAMIEELVDYCLENSRPAMG